MGTEAESLVGDVAVAGARIVPYCSAQGLRGYGLLRGQAGQETVLITGRPVPVATVLTLGATGSTPWTAKVAGCGEGRADGEFVVRLVFLGALSHATLAQAS
jgi:hypothetical protein